MTKESWAVLFMKDCWKADNVNLYQRAKKMIEKGWRKIKRRKKKGRFATTINSKGSNRLKLKRL